VAEGELTFLEMKDELGHQPFRAGAWLCDVQSLVHYRAAKMFEEAKALYDAGQELGRLAGKDVSESGIKGFLESKLG